MGGKAGIRMRVSRLQAPFAPPRGEVAGAYLLQLLQGPLLLLELGDRVFSKREVPSQGADLVIQGLEMGRQGRGWTLRLGTPSGGEGEESTCPERGFSAWLFPRATWEPKRHQCPGHSPANQVRILGVRGQREHRQALATQSLVLGRQLCLRRGLCWKYSPWAPQDLLAQSLRLIEVPVVRVHIKAADAPA